MSEARLSAPVCLYALLLRGHRVPVQGAARALASDQGADLR